jgi:DNA primase
MGVVDEIKERLDIVEVIQSYVPLKKAGRNYQGLCPFHTEKTPSFVVFPETGTWHCFGACATGGDVLSFIMKRENLAFGEALQMLARRAGIELEPRSPRAAEAERRLDLLREINQAAATYFHHLLLESDEAARARSYLERRGLQAATLERFQLGYALDQWDGLLRYLSAKSYAPADLVEAGVIVEREDKSGHYDRFRGRIMFPIRDVQGRTIGFGARAMADAQPKYINSPQTPLFDKSGVLYGLDQARAGIRTAGEAVIVEGYMDVLMAHQFGIVNVVAQMGTALTEEQLRLLKRHTRRFVLALDSDAAGDQATLRGLDVARQVMDRDVVPVITPRGLIRYEERLAADIRIVSLPPGLDPDEVIRDNPAHWTALVGEASPVMDYYFQVLTAGLDLGSARGKAEAVRLLGPLVAEVGDRVQRSHYLQMLARMVQVDEKALWLQIRQSRGGVRPAPARPAPVGTANTSRLSLDLDAHCLSFALYYPALLEDVDEVLLACDEPPFGPEDLRGAEEKAILESWRRWLADGGSPLAQGEFYDTLEEVLQARVNTLIQARAAQPPAPDDLLRDKVLDAFTELRLRGPRRQVHEMRFLQEDAQAAADREAHRRYGKLIVDLSLRIRRLEQSRDARSVAGRRRTEDALVRVPYGAE